MRAFVVAVLDERHDRALRTAEMVAAKHDRHGQLLHHGVFARRERCSPLVIAILLIGWVFRRVPRQ